MVPIGTTTIARTTLTTAATTSATLTSSSTLAVRHMSVVTLLAFAESNPIRTSPSQRRKSYSTISVEHALQSGRTTVKCRRLVKTSRGLNVKLRLGSRKLTGK